MTSSKSDVVLLFGGQSPEHNVSCTSASHVYSAIPKDRYNVTLVGIDQSGNWHKCSLPDEGPAPKEPLVVSGSTITPDQLFTPSANAKPIVFPVLHGPNGEDGTIQGLLETFEVPYVGSGVLSSSLCMDKIKSKELLSAHGIPQVSWISFHAEQLASASETIETSSLEFPLFVKPANMGSSIGVSRVLSIDDLDNAIEKARNYDAWIIVEESSPGREIEVAVLETNNIIVSNPGEITPGADFYDYDDKYDDGATLHVPAELSGSEIATVQSLAEDVFKLMRCKSLARIDFFYEPEGAGWLVNEINTMPGFTPISMYPKLWQEAGISYEDLIVKLLESATRE